MKPAIIFWDSPGYRVGDLETKAELAGPFVERDGLHRAWRWADTSGYTVMDTARTRALIKERPLEKKERET